MHEIPWRMTNCYYPSWKHSHNALNHPTFHEMHDFSALRSSRNVCLNNISLYSPCTLRPLLHTPPLKPIPSGHYLLICHLHLSCGTLGPARFSGPPDEKQKCKFQIIYYITIRYNYVKRNTSSRLLYTCLTRNSNLKQLPTWYTLASFYNTFIIILYMFRALYAHHQEVELYWCSIWYRHSQ